MGMFDHYRPRPNLACPVCGASDLDWQGKGGPCALFVWEQGQASPVGQGVDDECRIPAESMSEFRLPVRFEIYAGCRCPTFLEAVGFSERGVWSRTELMSPANAVASPDESEREFRKRVAGYAARPGHVN